MANAEWAIEYEQSGLPVFTTGFAITVGDTPQELSDFMQALMANWAANIMPSLSQDVVIIGSEIKSLDSAAAATVVTGAGTAGGQLEDSSPVNVCAVINRKDSSSRRDGRWFLPGVPESKVNGGATLDSAWYSNLVAQCAVVQANVISTLTGGLANRHKVGENPDLSPIYSYVEVQTFGGTGIVGSQSRRRR